MEFSAWRKHKHIDHIAELLSAETDVIAMDSETQIEQYLNRSPALKTAYLRMCSYAKQHSMPFYNPHMDKRWMLRLDHNG